MYDVEKSRVAKFLSQQVVFLTGVTSGVGMMLLYKILMCGPSRVFVLLRPKDGIGAEQRFKELIKNDIFDSLPREVLERVLVVEGDITKPLLELNIRDLIELRSSATLGINCAGKSEAKDSVSSQILHNVFGLEQFLQVCEGMENLKAVLTLSTCFAHVNRTSLGEKLYPVQQSLLSFPKSFNLMESQLAQTLTRRAVHEPQSLDEGADSLGETFRTAHNFSKQLSEHLLHFCQLPVVLVRTVHVSGALRDPYPGWFQGTDPVLKIAKLVSTRLTTGLTCESKNGCLMSPIDLVANTILLCIYRRARIREKGCRVCHCSPGAKGAVSWGAFIRGLLEISQEKCTKSHSRTPWVLLTPFHAITFLLFIFLDLVCALMNDVIAIAHLELPGNTFRSVQVYRDLHKLSAETKSKISPETGNAELLLDDLSEADKELFGTSLNEIDWRDYCECLMRRSEQL